MTTIATTVTAGAGDVGGYPFNGNWWEQPGAGYTDNSNQLAPSGAATITEIAGETLHAVASSTSGNNFNPSVAGPCFIVCFPAGLVQDFFTAVRVTETGGSSVTFDSDAATFNPAATGAGNLSGFTTWAWSTVSASALFTNGIDTLVEFIFPASYAGGQGDITNPGAWEDPEGNIPPLAFQQVPQTVNYPLNGDGRYWFVADASVPTPDAITFIGDLAFLVGFAGFQWSITQAATDGSALYLAYSIDGTTFTQVQLGPSLQRGSLTNGLLVAALAGATTLILKAYTTGGTADASAPPWNVAVAITRNTNEQIAWSSPNPFDPMAYNGECVDEVVPTETLLQLRTDLINRLGFKAVLPEVASYTLAQLRVIVMQRVGFSSQTANPPPGMSPMVDTIINEAQQTVYRRYAQDTYADTAPPLLVNDADVVTLDNLAVQMMAVGLIKAHYGQPDAQQILKQVETYLQELFKRSPPNLVNILNSFLIDGQKYLYRRYSQLHTRRMFRWKINPGQRFYSLKDNDEDVLCNYQMDPLKTVEWAGIQDSRNVWYPLVEGIDPQLYTMIDKPWRPARYEIRQAIELYPAPDQTYWMWIKAHFGLRAFAADSDSTTIDAELLFLHALANAKAHYSQRDADNIQAEANAYRKQLIAGTHGTSRYIPGTQAVPAAIRPTLIRFSGDGSNS